MRDARFSIIQVPGTVNKKYNSCSLKFIQHFKHLVKHLVSALGQASEVLVKKFYCSAMLMELVRDISRIVTKVLGCTRISCLIIAKFLNSQELERETSGTGSYSLFLVDLAERLPE